MENFKEKLKTDFIPFVEKLLGREKSHLDFLKRKKADKKMIDYSESMVKHLQFRLKQYKEYVD